MYCRIVEIDGTEVRLTFDSKEDAYAPDALSDIEEVRKWIKEIKSNPKRKQKKLNI